MWLELGVIALLLVAAGQSALLVLMWRQSRRLQQRVDALWQNAAGTSTDVPTSMLVTALGRVERKLGAAVVRTDADGVTRTFPGAGHELSDVRNESRMRFQDIIANRLNTRRALRELVVAPLAELQAEVARLRLEVARLSESLAESRAAGNGDPR